MLHNNTFWVTVSRSDSQIEERRNLSNTSTNATQRSYQKSASPQVQSIASEQNGGTLTDRSSSFESSVSTSARRHGPASRKEVRFRDDVAPFREIQQRNHHLATDGEFIKETSAFRAAMNYDDDDDDSETKDISEGQRDYYQAENKVDEMVFAQTRHITPAQFADDLANKSDPNVKLQSPSKQRGESSM